MTAHSSIDYADVVRRGKVIVDFRNATKGVRGRRQGLEAVKKVGVVGLGYWGPNLARNFDELGALAALCDLDEALRERFAQRHPNAQVYADYDELLADDSIDGVVIATPVPTHYPLAKRALEAGKHVLVEKPPAMRALRDGRARRARRVELARAHAGPSAALPPGRAAS